MEESFRVIGGVPLNGEVQLSGSKNCALPILAAALLVDDIVVLKNVPKISDISTICKMISLLGAKIAWQGNTLTIDARKLTSTMPDRDLSVAIRASYYLIAPLLARLHKAEVPIPGGCYIGSRPIDYVITALRQLGVHAEEQIDLVICHASNGLHGAQITLDPKYRSPGATFTAVMAAVLAKGRSIIDNASADPDVENFCHFLCAAGASIEGIGSTRLTIEGKEKLHGCEHEIISDRIEAGTYLIAAAATHGEVRVTPIKPRYIESLLAILEKMGAAVIREENAVTVRYEKRLQGCTVYTEPFPGFPTDMQPMMVVLMCLAAGNSEMHEAIYDGRLNYVRDLRGMGAMAKLEGNHQVIIEGVEKLHCGNPNGADMRAGVALIIAALAAEGESRVNGRKFVARGYENLEEKLCKLGAQIFIPAPEPGTADTTCNASQKR